MDNIQQYQVAAYTAKRFIKYLSNVDMVKILIKEYHFTNEDILEYTKGEQSLLNKFFFHIFLYNILLEEYKYDSDELNYFLEDFDID